MSDSANPAAGIDFSSFPRPLPDPEPAAQPFWRALTEGRLDLPRCGSCKKWIFYPRTFCPGCSSGDVKWETTVARGRVYTFSIVRRPTNPFFFGSAPYVYALVELENGVRLPTQIVNVDPERVRIGASVEGVFEKVNDQVTLLHFQPSQ